MSDLRALFRRAAERFGELAGAVREDQWHRPTPCDDWDVMRLVHHMTHEILWVPDLMSGATIAEVGERHEGDILGGDPVAAYRRAAARALEAVMAEGSFERAVHLSYGVRSGRHYTFEVMNDLLIHGWDLARAIGTDERLDPESVRVVYEQLKPREDAMKATGLFGPKVVPPPHADLQQRLLAVTGRRSW